MPLFHSHHHTVSLSAIDPLGAGLAEEIAAEQREPEAIRLDEDIEAGILSEKWQEVVNEVHQDPNWFSFADEERST